MLSESILIVTSDVKWALILPNNFTTFPGTIHFHNVNVMFHILYHLRPPVFVLLFSILSLFCGPQKMNSSPQGSCVHRILQARILNWAAIPFSRRSFWPRDWILVSCIAGRFFTIWVIKKPILSLLIFFHKPKKEEQMQKNFQKLPSPYLIPVQMFLLPVNLGDVSLTLCVKNRFHLCNIFYIFSTTQGLLHELIYVFSSS